MSNINVNNLTPLLGSGSSVSVSGSLVVKNDCTIGGHLYIGDQDTDSVTFSAEVSSSVIPDATVTYDLGSSAKKWSSIYLNSLVTHHITASGNISASGTGTNGTGSFHHVATNGNITASGTGSFEGGVIANNATGSFGYVSSSGDISASGDIYCVTGSFAGGIDCIGDGKNATGSFGYISASGDISTSADLFAVSGTFEGGVSCSDATGSFGQVTADGDISSSGTGSFMDVFIDDNLEVQGVTNLHGNISSSNTVTASFGYVSSSGNLSASGVGYFAGGVETDVTSTGSFGYVSSSGNLSASGVGYFAGGVETDVTSTGSFGYISSSGDLTASGTGSFGGGIDASTATGSLGYVSASGNIYATQYYVGSTGALIALAGNKSANSVKLGGGASVTQIHGLSIDVTGSISMSGAISMSDANANISTDQGTIYAGGQISSSADLHGTHLTLATAGVNAFTVAANGNMSSSGTLAGTTLTLGDTGVNVATVDALGNISGSGTGSFVSLNVTDAGTAVFNVDTNGHVSASGRISSSAGLFGTAFTAATNGDIKATIDASGNISGAGAIEGNSFNITNNGDNVFSVTNAGAVSASSTMAATSIEFATNGTAVAAISSTGTGSFNGGIDCIGDGKNATGSFGYISASQDVSSSGTVFGEAIIAGAGNSIIKGNIKLEGGMKRPLKTITTTPVTLDATSGVNADAGKTIVLNKADGATITLPAAAGSGDEYRFFIGTAISSNSYIIKVADATDTISGAVHMVDADDDSQTTITAKGTDDTITLNGGTTGGAALGDVLVFTDIAANKYIVQGNLIVPAGSNPADPFSATVS